MKNLFLFLLPVFTYAQITRVPNDSLGEHIGLHIIYFLGRVNGGVSLGKLPDVNGREYHQLIWTNRDYDKKGERTILRFQSTSDDINNLFELFKEVNKTQKTKIIKLEDKIFTIMPSSIKNEVTFRYESDGVNKYFYISSIGIYELFGKTWSRIEKKSTKAKP
jgi:hypothetical protein|tara:strand:- start:36 stop:524 length:489 start_codon:yes stop_codon:yes gene_type:complete